MEVVANWITTVFLDNDESRAFEEWYRTDWLLNHPTMKSFFTMEFYSDSDGMPVLDITAFDDEFTTKSLFAVYSSKFNLCEEHINNETNIKLV